MLSSCRNISLSRKTAKQLEFLSFLLFLLLHRVDQVADVVDVIAEENAGEEGEDDEQEGFWRVGRMKVTKPDGEDDSSPEVVAPDVLLAPGQEVEAALSHPAVLLRPGDPE